MAILLESKFSLLSVTCVINLLCDLTPIYLYLYLLPLLHTHPAAQQPSWPWLFLPPGLCSFLCLRRPLWDPTQTSLSSFFTILSDIFFLLPPAPSESFVLSLLSFLLQWDSLHSACSRYSLYCDHWWSFSSCKTVCSLGAGTGPFI